MLNFCPMKYLIILIITIAFTISLKAQTKKVEDDNQGIAVNYLLNINIPNGYIFSPTLYYRSQFRPLNRPIHLFINPNMGMVKIPDADRINAETGQLDEDSKKTKFGIAPQVSIGIPIFYNAKYRIANALKGTDFTSNSFGEQTTYYIQQGYVPTHQALIAEIGYAKFPEYDSFGPSIFYGLRWYITQKGKIDDSEEGYYYNIKQVMSLFLHFYKRLDSDQVFKDIPEDNLRKTGYKFGVEYTRGGSFGMLIAMGGCPGKKDAYGGTSGVIGYLDIGVYKTIGLWKAPF